MAQADTAAEAVKDRLISAMDEQLNNYQLRCAAQDEAIAAMQMMVAIKDAQISRLEEESANNTTKIAEQGVKIAEQGVKIAEQDYNIYALQTDKSHYYEAFIWLAGERHTVRSKYHAAKHALERCKTIGLSLKDKLDLIVAEQNGWVGPGGLQLEHSRVDVRSLLEISSLGLEAGYRFENAQMAAAAANGVVQAAFDEFNDAEV